MQATQNKHILVEGRVQGVGYRYMLRQKALALGLTGWCRNLADGRVEAEAAGSPEALTALLDWCHQGPPSAEVSNVEIRDIANLSHPSTGFDIR